MVGWPDVGRPPNLPPLIVLESHVDAAGNIRVQEQGTVPVTGTAHVDNSLKVQDILGTNLPAAETGAGLRIEGLMFPSRFRVPATS